MITKITYGCQFCNFSSEFPRKVKEHEAEHLGVSVNDVLEWKKLDRAFVEAAAMEQITKNEVTSADVDAAYETLAKFEREHGLADKDIPKW